ncbi:MAG: PASTA domain-containing protein [Flavobacteriales bacterium Tduv]
MGISKPRFYVFLVNLLIAGGVMYIIAQAVFGWLSVYTKHDRYVTVPDLSSLTLGQATLRLKELGLNYEVDTSRYDPDFVPYHIFSFAPQTGDRVKKNRIIFIQANAGTFKFTTLPDIIYKNKRLALSQLELKHLLVKDITYVPDISKETVLKVIYNGKPIHPGAVLPYRAELDLVIGKGYKKNVAIPDVIKMDLSSAQALLEENQFTVGKISYDQPKDTADAKIYRQDPLPGEVYDQGQYINLWLTVTSQDSLNSLIQEHRSKEKKNQDISGDLSVDESTSFFE